MNVTVRIIVFALLTLSSQMTFSQSSWIRINQLGYKPEGIKVAVWGGKEKPSFKQWQLIDAVSKKVVLSAKSGKFSGAYGPFSETLRLNFSAFKNPGRYYLQAGNTLSPEFEIGNDVY